MNEENITFSPETDIFANRGFEQSRYLFMILNELKQIRMAIETQSDGQARLDRISSVQAKENLTD